MSRQGIKVTRCVLSLWKWRYQAVCLEDGGVEGALLDWGVQLFPHMRQLPRQWEENCDKRTENEMEAQKEKEQKAIANGGR